MFDCLMEQVIQIIFETLGSARESSISLVMSVRLFVTPFFRVDS